MVSTTNYINKRGITKPWEIYPKINRKFSHAIIIPCFGEYEELPNLLKSIEKNDAFLLKDILVIIIINNWSHMILHGGVRNNGFRFQNLNFFFYWLRLLWLSVLLINLFLRGSHTCNASAKSSF